MPRGGISESGAVLPYGAVESWRVAIVERFLGKRVVAEFTGASVEPPEDNSATFRIWIAKELTQTMRGEYLLQIDAVYPGERAPVRIAQINPFVIVEQGF